MAPPRLTRARARVDGVETKITGACYAPRSTRSMATGQPRWDGLVVLDLNGTIIHCRSTPLVSLRYDARVNRRYVYLRPGLYDFLNWLFTHVHVAVWTSAMEHNARALVDCAFGEHRPEFLMHRAHCTHLAGPGWQTQKDLWRLWSTYGRGNRWNECNTLLVDDTSEKCRPNHVANTLVVCEFNPCDKSGAAAADDNDNDDGAYLRTVLPRLIVQRLGALGVRMYESPGRRIAHAPPSSRSRDHCDGDGDDDSDGDGNGDDDDVTSSASAAENRCAGLRQSMPSSTVSITDRTGGGGML